MHIGKILGTALIAASLTAIATSATADSDPVIMTIGGTEVPRSEFVYSYTKNNGDEVIDRKSVKDYVELFINYKRKVLAALDAQLDTMASYNSEFRQYRDQQVRPTLINDADVEQEAQNIYKNTKERIGPDGLVNPYHILIRVGQNDGQDAMDKAKERADSVYNALMQGADFSLLAQKVSQDPGSAPRGGNIGWIQHGQTLKAFDAAAFALKDGEVSEPVLTEVGYHVIKMMGHKDIAPYDSLREDIHNFIEKRKIREVIAQNRLKAIADSRGMTREEVMDARADSLSAVDQNAKYLIKEYHDGLLLYEISNRMVWEKASRDSIGQEQYYKKNKKKYRWDTPRFKGIAYHTRDVADIAAVKKALKGKEWDDWAQLLRTTFNNDSVLRIRAEKGLFKKGDNALVDRDVFGVADATPKEIKDFPHTATYGRLLKAPESISDVRALVVADYQDEMEKQWLKELETRYPATVNEDVLTTVKDVE